MVNHEDIFRTGIALLAFVVAFFAVIARERKTPYILNSIYTITFIVLASLLLSLLAKILNSEASERAAPVGIGVAPSGSSLAARVATGFNWGSVVILGCGIAFIYYRVWRIQNRQINFRDDQLRYTIRPLLWWRRRKQRSRRQKAYEHNAQSLPPELIASLKQSQYIPRDQLESALIPDGLGRDFSMSAVFVSPTRADSEAIMTDLAIRFLDQGCFVQYTTCRRHPIEFLFHLEREWQSLHPGQDWKRVKDQVVLIDAYSPHFGFTDTIYTEWSADALNHCLDCVESPATYAGVHTALANGFNEVKKKRSDKKLRKPTLNLYEGMHALVDLESNEQYRIFLRHVIPSERLWGGMFTVFIESSILEENLAVMKEISTIFTDRTEALRIVAR